LSIEKTAVLRPEKDSDNLFNNVVLPDPLPPQIPITKGFFAILVFYKDKKMNTTFSIIQTFIQ
jgi:hypothetical protein